MKSLRAPISKLILITAAALFFSHTNMSIADDNANSIEPGDELFIKHVVQVAGFSIPYSVFVSPKINLSNPAPVILAFHGSGERGSDGILNTRAGIGPALRTHADLFPAIVVMPQLPSNKVWSDKADSNNPNSPTYEDLSLAALEETIAMYSADRTHVYITGNSLGGFATYEVAASHHDIFAAALPIAGGGDISLAPELKDIPIWAAHGLWDQDVKIHLDRDLVNAIRNSGNHDIHFTIHWFRTHDVWDVTYSDKKIMNWLFQQKLNKSN